MEQVPIPLTVVGGYLGAGKTTLLNHVLRHAGGRRIGVIVNDFGSLAIDADLLATAGGDDVIGLPNGCVCCTIGAGLHEALTALAERRDVLDHVVIEASGVADPAVAAGWATVPPFAPGGIVVLAAADTIRRQSRDRFVGGEVLRQLAGADLVVLTKTDLLDDDTVSDVRAWLGETGGAPVVVAVDGRIDPTVVLGVAARVAPGAPGDGGVHLDLYATWSWESDDPVDEAQFQRLLAAVAEGVLRLKGTIRSTDGRGRSIDVVGRRVEVRPTDGDPGGTRLVAVGERRHLDIAALDAALRSE